VRIRRGGGRRERKRIVRKGEMERYKQEGERKRERERENSVFGREW
jgi:hypothetical protein